MIDRVLALLLLSVFVLLFAVGALHKFRSLVRFRAVLEAYRVLPERLIAGATLGIPFAEAAVAVGLVWPGTRAVAASLGIALLLAYCAGLALNLKRGRLDLDCGCTGPAHRRPIAAYMVWRNLGLVGLLTLALLPVRWRALEATDFLTLLGGVSCAVVLYAALDAALARRAPAAVGSGEMA